MESKLDLIVGIPSYNEADSIEYVARKSDEGIVKYFGDLNCAIVNCDNNSPDDTKSVFLNTETQTEKKYISTPPGVKGKGNNFFNLFNFAAEKEARAVVVVDADLTSITGEWIKKLATPVFEAEKDFVSPLYLRHKYDGTITNNLVFPLVYSLMNKHARQPIGGDFAVSSRLVDHYLKQEWTNTVRQYGIDIFMTMNALVGGFSMAQVLLGAKLHKPSAPKLGPMFTEVMTSLFDIITGNPDSMNNNPDRERPLPEYELPDIEPPDIAFDPDAIKQTALMEFKEYRPWLEMNLNHGVNLFGRIDAAFKQDVIGIDPNLWSDIVFKLLEDYNGKSPKEKAHLIEAFKPLYRGATYNFVRNTENLSSLEAEERVVAQADLFWDKRTLRLRNGLNK
jgi:glycosyltransferase involved in cell wall biosynthesis